MKKKSTSQSAFFNLRVLLASALCLAGVFLALVGFGASSAHAQQKPRFITYSADPLVPLGFDCSRISELGINKQENFRAGAIMIACGEAQGGSASSAVGAFSQLIQKLLAPTTHGGVDINLITGAETSPNVTQSETFSWTNPDDPNQIVVAYNDSRGRNQNPINISGASVSTDGGTNFTRLTKANGQSPFDNTLGDPVVLYNSPTGFWFTVWLDGACGGQGLGGYKSDTPSDPDSWTHFCVHNGFSDDRESGWVDNNPASPFYGHMYVSWNNFADGGSLRVRSSTDNGLTWGNERQVAPASPFIRDVQITGDLATGTVYVAGMNEMGGGLGDRANHFYRSTDGGDTWTNSYTGPAFPGPGVAPCPHPYFACMFPDGGGYWRHMGWGQPAALNGIVHYVYASRNTGNGDPGNIFYIRSTDGGSTFGEPLQLNTDTTTRPQWQPSLSLHSTNTGEGILLAVWYDARETANCEKGNPAVPCYRMYASRSTDNGHAWSPDEAFSDETSPLPGQPDPGIVAEYAGDYDYGTGSLATALPTNYHAWVDGRVAVSESQQDVFFDRDPPPAPTASVSPSATASATATATATFTPTATATATATPNATATATATATCTPGNNYVITQIGGSIVPGTTDTGIHCDDCVTNVALPDNFTYTTYDQSFNSINLSSNGNAQFVTNDSESADGCLPWGAHDAAVFPHWDDLRTDNLGWAGCAAYPNGQCGIFTSVTGSAPNRIFNIEWRAVYSAMPANQANFELRLYEGQTRFDVIYGTVSNGNISATAGVQKDDTAFDQYFCNGSGGAATGGQSYILQSCGIPTPTPTPTPTATPTATPTPSCTPAWSSGPNLSSPAVRAVGVFFPPNGKFYVMGGRSSDAPGSEFTHPFEYDPATNTWTVKSATYPDNQVGNMACGVLTINDTATSIYCAGGSAAGQTTATDRVFRYDPVADVITTVPAPWPGAHFPGGTEQILPGGFSVWSDGFPTRFYILGGFNINVGMVNTIWEFNPETNVWVQKGAVLPQPLGFIPTTTIGNFIYTGGGSNFQNGFLVDGPESFRYDPVADSITTIAPIPRATGETRALTVNGNMWVLGGGRTAPNPSNQVNVYDPATNTWSLGPAFATARRNFPVDSYTDHINLAGGYASDGVVSDTLEILGCPPPTPTPTPTATPTATSTPTPTPTPTATCGQYTITQIGGSIVPGTTDTGNHANNLVTTVALPFTVQLYDQSFDSINLSSNGNAQFTTTASTFTNVCLPWNNRNYAIMPHWDDLRTDAQPGCAAFPGGTCGIFTVVSGSAPNRIFIIEWRTTYFNNTSQAANFELVFYERQSFFDVFYGQMPQGETSATAGVQKNNTALTQYFCNGSGGQATGGQRYTQGLCPPGAPTALQATNVTATSFTALWGAGQGGGRYRLDVATDNSFVTYVPGYEDLDVGNTTSWNVTGLTANTFYYYRLRAYNGNGTSPNSNVIKVKTKRQ